jgi:hypothetical protein
MNQIDKELYYFVKQHGMHILNERLEHPSRHNSFFNDPEDANVINTTISMQPERIFIMEIPANVLQKFHNICKKHLSLANTGEYNLATTIIDREWHEHRLRREFPAVEAAWQQYSLMLHLAKQQTN